MQSNYGSYPLSQQTFDMRGLAAAMPQPFEPSRHRYSDYPVDRVALSAPMLYPPYDTSQQGQSPQFRYGVTSDSRWDHQVAPQARRYNNGLGVYGSGLYSFPPPNRCLNPQATFAPAPILPGTSALPDHGPIPRTSVPSSPRGPPRKPKRSGHALWVGNLPPFARIEELKDHFSSGATQTIESVFLISKSNCAFINYQSEGACVAAMNRFHNSRFGGRSLVCRLRLSTTASSSPATLYPAEWSPMDETPSVAESASVDKYLNPLIVGGKEKPHDESRLTSRLLNVGTKSAIPEKYFILKSLTLEDLEASVVSCVWALQPHNEDVLNKAYAEADDVYLIFSANKSGQYFGYARMTSSASKNEMKSVTTPELNHAMGSLKMVATPATATAPKGRIVDDSARGSIFWEADHLDDSIGVLSERESSNRKGDGHFSIEWISTTKISFYQTRGMRNPWNGNREIKIARDGQELDPRVGRRLVQLF